MSNDAFQMLMGSLETEKKKMFVGVHEIAASPLLTTKEKQMAYNKIIELMQLSINEIRKFM